MGGKAQKKIFLLCFFALLALPFLSNAKSLSGIVRGAPNSNVKKIELAQITKQGITPTPAGQANTDNLQKYLTVQAALLGVADDISLYFKDYQNEKDISLDPSRSWIPASTIKSFVALEAFKQRRVGLISFDQIITIKAENVVPTELETDEFPRLREGMQATTQQLIEAMIIQSDNTAYNTLLDILDRRNINATLKDIGLTETVVGEKLNLDDGQFSIDVNIPGRQSNTTTVKDYASFFDLLYRKQIPDSEEILSIFKRQKINNMIPAFLPQDIVVAHKTGDWAPIYHDGGIVYKPDDPFLLAIFTKDNDPAVLSQLAKVAYFRNADVVGPATPTPAKDNKVSLDSTSPIIYLAQNYDESKVLGESTSEKFPTVTAQDLGITKADLAIDRQDTTKIANALITPGSPFYTLKRLIETVKSKIAFTPDQKIAVQSSLSASRLAEVKTLMKSGRLDEAKILLSQSEESLNKSVGMMKDNKVTDKFLPRIKQLNDLHFATLAEVSKNLSGKQKEQFVDMVYEFYQKNKKEVKPAITNSLVANPLKQQPIIGTVKEINNNIATIQFDNGGERAVSLDSYTPIREFHKKTLDNDTSQLAVGSKIAVIGQTTNTGIVIPQFILRDVPKEIPDKQEGVVLQINSKQNILEILNRRGEREIIKISQDTKITGKDTSASLLGIKAGSIITVFGEIEKDALVAASISNLTISQPASYSIQLLSPTGKGGKGNVFLSPSPQPTGSATRVSQTPPTDSIKQQPPSGEKTGTQTSPVSNKPTVINATSITVTNNSSGKQEKSSSSSKKDSGPSPNSKPSTTSKNNQTKGK